MIEMIIKISICLITLLTASKSAFPKGKEGPHQPRPPINKVSPLDKESLLKEVQWIVKDAMLGKLQVLDENCLDLSIEVKKDYLKATVNKENFYILKNAATIESQEYQSSICYKKTLRELTQIECISRSTRAINTVDETKVLNFYMSYSDRAIVNCPSLGTLFL